jgi:hypothetical protein
MNPQLNHLRSLFAVIAIIGFAAFVLLRPQTERRDGWLPSSVNPGPQGHKALYTTLERLGWPVARWHSSYSTLDGINQVMIVTRHHFHRRESFTPEEIHRLMAWVAQGNSIILLGAFSAWEDTALLLSKSGFDVPPPPKKNFLSVTETLLIKEREAIVLYPPGPSRENPSTLLIEESPALPRYSNRISPLWTSQQGTYLAKTIHGAGEIVFCSTPSLIDNQFLRERDNLNYVLHLLAPNGDIPKTIWFEEVHHGYRMNYPVTELLKEPGLKLALWQIALGILVFFTSQAIRFGPVIPYVREKNRSGLEFVRSMAQLYHRADLRNEIIQSIFEETHRSVLRKLNLPPRTSHAIVSERLEQAFPHLPSWKKLANRFDTHQYIAGLPPKGWLKAAQDLIKIKREMS